jgi:hypothetical protein
LYTHRLGVLRSFNRHSTTTITTTTNDNNNNNNNNNRRVAATLYDIETWGLKGNLNTLYEDDNNNNRIGTLYTIILNTLYECDK